MKKIISLALLCAAVILSSCKKEDSNPYPETITSGLWAGTNASTGYSCDLMFTVSGSTGNNCQITLSSPGNDKTGTGVFQGQFTYDRNNGTVSVSLDALDGAPSKATLQFDQNGKALAVSFTAAGVNYGTYTVAAVTYPKSIAGKWNYTAPGMTVSAELYPYAVNSGLPYKITVLQGQTPIEFTGIYTYDPATGKGTVKAMIPDAGTVSFAIQYNTDGTLSCETGDLLGTVKLTRQK